MSRILAVSRVVIANEYRIRFLCIRDSVDSYKARVMMSNVSYPCYSIYDVAGMFNNKDDLYCLDYPLKNANILSTIPIVTVGDSLKIRKIRSEENVYALLNRYNPYLLNKGVYNLSSDLLYLDSGWISYKGGLICSFKPTFKDDSMFSHFRLHGGVLQYCFEKDVYILTDENVRHRPAKLGEVVSINLDSLDCVKYIQKIDKSNNYTESVLVFDRILRDWVTVRSSEPVIVLGRKDR